MNVENLKLMTKMLQEVLAGTWKPTVKVEKVLGMKPTKIVKQRFDLSNWIGLDDFAEEKNSCGFTACAVGHAMSDIRFAKRGLGIENPSYLIEGFRPTFKGFENWKAVHKFFDIMDSDVTEYLFSDENYPKYLTKEPRNSRHLIAQVIRRIQLLLKVNKEDAFLDFMKNWDKKSYILDPSLKPRKIRL